MSVRSIVLLLVAFVAGNLTGWTAWSGSYLTATAATAATTTAATATIEQSAIVPPSNSKSELPTFTELVNASGSDKFFMHHYEHYYTEWLEPYRRINDVTMLEIGVLHGESLEMWEKYFVGDQKHIYGLAYGAYDAKDDALSSAQILRGDQSKTETMDMLINTKGPFDVIIDDGSHIPQHQVFTFFSLWKAIKPGGMFVVEDIETNYWNPVSMPRLYGYNLNNTGFGKGPHYNAVDKFKQFIDILPRNQLGRPADISIMEGDDTICGIDFGKNLMRFRKCRLDQTPPIVKQDNTYTGPRIVRIWRNEAMQSNPPGFNHDHVALKKAKNV